MVWKLAADLTQIQIVPEDQRRLARLRGRIRRAAEARLGLAQAKHAAHADLTGLIVLAPAGGRVIPLGGDPATVHQDGPIAAQEKRCEQMIAIIAAVVLVAQRK